MNLKVCAYCKEEKKLTREHLWPAGLHEKEKGVSHQVQTFLKFD